MAVSAVLAAGNSLDEAFPTVDPGVVPFGSRVLVQIRTAKNKTTGGIIIPEDARETEKWNVQTAKVVAMGPLAFHNRNTMEPWPEGQWCKIGDFVRVPKYGGDRWEVQVPDRPEGERAMFVIFDDLNVIGKVTADPTSVKAYL